MILPNEHFLEVFKSTSGALSVTEGIALMNLAAQAPKGTFAEFGTHKGKSALAILYGGKPEEFHINDLIFSDNEIAMEVVERLKSIEYDNLLCVWEIPSIEVIPKYKGEGYSFAFLDTGDHGEELVQSEKVLLEDAIIEGGILAFHDYKNQFTAVEKAYNELVATGKFAPIHIDWQLIFDYVKEHDLENGNNSWHLYPELPHPPNFVGALKRI